MADVASNLFSWSTTASSNLPADATTIGAGLADNLQEIQKVVRQDLAHKGADIASATTTDLGAVIGHQHTITGTTTITGFGTVAAGIWKIIKFDGALVLTHNATSLILRGAANITTAAGDVAIMVSEGSGNWRCVSYARAETGTGSLVLSASPTFTGTINAAALTLSSVLNLDAGTVSAPGLYVEGETGSGLYRIGANNHGYSISGAKVLDIASTGLAVTGAISASTNLTVTGGTITTGAATALSLATSGGTQFNIGHAASASDYWQAQGSNAAGAELYTIGGTNVNGLFKSKGSGYFSFATAYDGGGPEQLRVTHTASANRYITLTGSNGGNPTISTSAGALALGNGQLQFPASQNASSDANTLDDYEEGTFTATLDGQTTSPNTPITSTARYTKIGRVVHVDVQFSNVDTTGASGNIVVTGCPFTNNASLPSHGACVFIGLGTVPSVTYVPISTGSLFPLDMVSSNYIPMVAGTGKYLWMSVTFSV